MVGQGASLTRLLAVATSIAAATAFAQSPGFVVDGGCRDGQPHGHYELRTRGGDLRVAGAFNHGKRTGSFIFWSESGARVAHIPYDDDARNGTIATWYEAVATPGNAEPRRRFESMWRHGERHGLTRTWNADGRRRSETEYEHGRQVARTGWSDAGARLSDRAAQGIAARDAAAADRVYAELEALVRGHLPQCD